MPRPHANYPTLATAARKHRATPRPAEMPDLVDEAHRCQRCHSRKYATDVYREALGERINERRILCAHCAAKRPNLWLPTTQRPLNRAQRRQIDQQHRRDVYHNQRWRVAA